MIKWSEEWALNRLNNIHKDESRAPYTEDFVSMMMEVTLQENRALNNFRNLVNLRYIIIHENKVMLKWYFDVFYHPVS